MIDFIPTSAYLPAFNTHIKNQMKKPLQVIPATSHGMAMQRSLTRIYRVRCPGCGAQTFRTRIPEGQHFCTITNKVTVLKPVD